MRTVRRGATIRLLVAVFCVLLLSLAVRPTRAEAASSPSVIYRASVQNVGWSTWQKNGTVAGLTGTSRQMEAIQLKLSSSIKGSIQYRIHVVGKGWQSWRAVGTVAGAKNTRIDAIGIRLTGELAKKYDVIYRVRVGGIGWLGWARNGAASGVCNGTANLGAMQVKLVTKGKVVTSVNSACQDLRKTAAIKLKHYMNRSLKQGDYGSNFKNGGCCAMSYAIGISIITKKDVNPTKYYRKDSYSSYYICYYDDGHMGTYRSGFDGAGIYSRLRSGKPTLVHYVWNGGQHWVCVVGVRAGAVITRLTYADFIVIDPRIGKECSLTSCYGFKSAHTIATMPMV